MANTRKSPANKRRLPTSYNNNKKKKSKKTSSTPSQAPTAAPSSTALTKDDRIARSKILDPDKNVFRYLPSFALPNHPCSDNQKYAVHMRIIFQKVFALLLLYLNMFKRNFVPE